MTFDRAIRLVELERDYLAKKNEPESKKLRMEIVEALDIALGTMEKQTPKTPLRECEGYPIECGLIICPTCGRMQPITYAMGHCKECGQKLELGGREYVWKEDTP